MKGIYFASFAVLCAVSFGCSSSDSTDEHNASAGASGAPAAVDCFPEKGAHYRPNIDEFPLGDCTPGMATCSFDAKEHCSDGSPQGKTEHWNCICESAMWFCNREFQTTAACPAL
jgi:hypothetical protein